MNILGVDLRLVMCCPNCGYDLTDSALLGYVFRGSNGAQLDMTVKIGGKYYCEVCLPKRYRNMFLWGVKPDSVIWRPRDDFDKIVGRRW
jgi:hypothetical protein